MKNVLSVLCLSALVSGSVLAADMNLTLSPRSDSDLGSDSLMLRSTKTALPAINTNRESVSFSQLVDSDQPLVFQAVPHTSTSREFWLDVSAAELSQGVEIPVSSRAAILRLSPTSSLKSAALSPSQLQLSQFGNELDFDAAFDRIANAEALKSAGMSVGEQTIALRMGQGVAAAPVVLRATGLTGSSDYVMHVFEPQSTRVLNVQASANSVISGQAMAVSVDLAGSSNGLKSSEISGYLVAPDGQTTVPLQFANNKATVDTTALSSAAPGLWEAHTFVRHDDATQVIMRDAKVAFAISPATARLSGDMILSSGNIANDAMSLSVGVEVGQAGRFEVSAVIFGDDGYGNTRPGVRVATAAWLDISGEIQLEIPMSLIAESGIQAPLSVGHLSLKDQTRMAELWRQEHAVQIPQLRPNDYR